MPLNKPLSRQITKRFLEEVGKIVTSTGPDKVTAQELGEKIKMRSTNFSRLQQPGNYVTLEAIALICKHYGVSAEYLITGKRSEASAPDLEQRIKNLEKKMKARV